MALPLCLLFELAMIGIVCVSGDHLIDIYSKVTVTSSSVLEDEGIQFVPQWAVDRINSRLWSSCFVSKKEVNPWWRLDLGKQESIRNVYLDLRNDDFIHQPDVKKKNMVNLTVYVDDSSKTAGGVHTLCGTAFTPTSSTVRSRFLCASLSGRYVHVIVKSPIATHLALCEVFINLVSVAGSTYTIYEGEYSIVRPGDDPSKPSSLAVDDDTATCASTNDSSTLQSLSVRFPWPIFLQTVRLFMNIYSGVTYKEYAGSHLSNDGLDNPERVFYASAKDGHAEFFTRRPSSFVRDITIVQDESSKVNETLQVCEVRLLQEGRLLDIYSSSSAAALSELNTSTLASKAIDNSFQTGESACYRSAQQPGTWWRLQSKEAKPIFRVVITPLPNSTALSEMDGFSVFVGNQTTNSGKDNLMCGLPWVYPSSGNVSTIQVTCVSRPIGKYVYVVASNRASSSLSLCEVQIFDCAGSDLIVSGADRSVSISASGMAVLTCNASGCPTPSIEWTGPDGQIVRSATHMQTGGTVTSTIDVQGSEGGKYRCIAYNRISSNVTKEITVSACDCHRAGSLHSDCDAMTGQCQCDSRATGRRCDTCAQLGIPFNDISECDLAANQSKVPFNCRRPLPIWNGDCKQVAKPGRTAAILKVSPNIVSGNSRLQGGFDVYWNGWTCLLPCTLAYNWAIYPLEPIGGSSVKVVQPSRGYLFQQATHEQPVPTPLLFSYYNPPSTLLMIEMNATATNGTTAVARTLVLADDNSRVDVAKDSEISFRSSFDDVWLTKDDERDSVFVEWKSDHFFNTYIKKNPWLLYRVDVSRPTYDTSEWPLSFSGVTSSNDVGVTSFRAWLRKKEIDGWSTVDSDFFLRPSAFQWSVPLSLSNGETYQVEIEAEDIFGHATNDSFIVYTDYEPPIVGNVSVWSRTLLPVSDSPYCTTRTGTGFLSLEVNAVDAESGVKEVTVSIIGQSTVTISAQHPDKCLSQSCTCALNGKCVLNDFTAVINSSAMSFSRVHVKATSYSGLMTTKAFDGVTVQKGGDSPTDLSIQSSGIDSLNVTWKYRDANVKRFSVIACRRSLNDNKCICTPKLNVVGTPPPHVASVTGLNPFSEYAVQVEAIAITGSSGLSDFVVGKTKEGPPDGPPLNVSGEGRFTPELGAHMIVLWEPPQLEHRNGIITSYYVNVYLGGLLARGEEKFVSSTRNTTIPNVRSGREYAVTVTAATRVGRGVPSVRTIVNTPDGTPSVPPGSVSSAAVHKDNVTIRWNSIPEDSRNGRLNYVVFYRPKNDAVNEQRIGVLGNVLSATIDGLRAFTDYIISVAGETTKGTGPRSDELPIRTDEDVPGPPIIARVDSIGTTALGVSWLPPSNPRGKITQYRIIVASTSTSRRRRADSSPFTVFADADDTFKVVDGLESGKSYSVAMDASTSKGWGERRQHHTTVRTQPKVVGAPEGLEATQVVKINSTALLIHWQNVSMNTTVPEFYTISHEEEAGFGISNVAKVDGSETEYEIQGLTLYTYYRITVASNGNPNKSSTVFAWTPEGRPGKLSYFEIPPESVDDASVLLEWKPPEKPNGRISYAFAYWSLVTGQNETKPPVILRPDELRLVADDRYRWRVSDLVGLTEYRFVMWAYNIRNRNWTGPESDPVEIRTDPGRPGRPTAFDVKAEDDGTLAVFWGTPRRPNGEILGYEVTTEWANETGTPATLTTIHRTARSERFQLVTGLEKPALYKVSLRAYNSEGLGIPSATSLRTRAASVDDGAPRNVNLDNSTYDSTTVTWKRPKALASPLSYYVNVLQDGTSFRRSLFVRQGTRARVDGLHSFTLHYAVVIASYSNGVNVSSMRRYFQTNSSSPTCPPRDFAIKTINSTHLRLEWVSPLSTGMQNGVACLLNGVLGGFHVRYLAANESGIEFSKRTQPEEHHIITSRLKPYTFYRASVAAITYGARDLGPSATEIARTSEGVPDAPEVFRYETTSNSVAVSWIVRKTNGILKWVRISVEGQSGRQRNTTVLEQRQGSTAFRDLMAYTFYDVIAVAASGAGKGLETRIRIRTNESVPDAAPTIHRCTALDDAGDDSKFDSFKLNFTTVPSSRWHGKPGNYRVYVQGKAAKETINDDDPIRGRLVETTATALDALETGVEYDVTVVAYTEHGGEGPASNPCTLFRPKEQVPEGSRGVAIGLGVFFPLLIVALVVVFAFFYWRKQTRTKQYSVTQPGFEMSEGNRYVAGNHWLNDWPKYDDFQFDRTRLDIVKEIGEGQFGKVYLAVAKNIVKDEKETRVAVKTVKGGSSRETAEDFRKEIQIMMDFDHPNVIALLGVCTLKEPLYLITELMKHGDLKEFVRAARASEERVRPLLSLEQLLNIASQAVAGVAHLASRKFVHRDIAARNCLVGGDDVGDDANYVVKIADFGMAKDVYVGDYYRKKGGALPVRWMAPEAIMDGKYTVESDTWSTGILLWEIFSFGFQPYFGQENEKVLGGIISGNLVLPCPPVTPEAVYMLMLRCWERLPSDRIPTSVVEDELKKMLVACTNSGVGAVYSYAVNHDYFDPSQLTTVPPTSAVAKKQESYVHMTDAMKKKVTAAVEERSDYTPETKPSSSSDHRKKFTSYVDMTGGVALGGYDDEEEPRREARAVPNQYEVLSDSGENEDAAKLPKMDSYVDMGTGDTTVSASPPLAAIPEASGAVENTYFDMGGIDSSPKESDANAEFADASALKKQSALAEKDKRGEVLVATSDVPETSL